uniref:Jacalin-type lectin domain-containing protein n=1 Tax=Tetraodon nigroviridis TaxID=99883 RepID=H3DP40_TETNG
MLSLLLLLALCSSALADGATYSFSPSVGSGTGTSYSLSGTGKITAVRVYEAANAYISGIQLRFGGIWTNLIGRKLGSAMDLELRDDEHIHQISGKYHPSNYIYQLIFYTSAGRSLIVGQPIQNSFNMYTARKNEQLIILSGRFNSAGITAIAAHWGSPDVDYGNVTTSS